MTMLRVKYTAPLICIPVILLLACAAQGRELSFAEALDLAARDATELQVLDAEQDIAEGVYQRSAQAFLPRIRGDVTWLRADSSLIQDIPVPESGLPPRIVPRDYGPVEGVASSVQVVQPVLHVDAWKARKQADLVRDARRLARRWGGEVMQVSVAARYFAVAVHERSVAAARMSVQAARHALRLAHASYREGIVARVDVYRASAELEGAKARLSSEEAQWRAARIDLATLLGLPDHDDVVLTSPLPEPQPSVERSTQAGSRPDYKAAKAQSDAAEAGLEKETARWLPRLNMVARQQWFDGREPFDVDSEGWLLAVNLQWTLFEGMDRKGAIAEAQARRRLSRIELERLRREVLREQEQTHSDWHAAWSAWQASTKALESATIAATLARRQYEEGVGSMNDMLVTQAQLHQRRVDHVRLQYRAFLVSMKAYLAHGLDPLEVFP
jgi:outer membrane protein